MNNVQEAEQSTVVPAVNGLAPEKAERLTLLSKEQALSEWDVLSKMFAIAIPRTLGRVTLDTLKANVEEGKALVVIAWNPDPMAPVIHAAFMVEGDGYPSGKKVFTISLCGGSDISEWGHLLWQFRDMAAELDFDQIQFTGRAGWSKFIGAKEVSRNYVEELK
jgi:hypothetical protein